MRYAKCLSHSKGSNQELGGRGGEEGGNPKSRAQRRVRPPHTALEYAHKRGIFFGNYPHLGSLWKPLIPAATDRLLLPFRKEALPCYLSVIPLGRGQPDVLTAEVGSQFLPLFRVRKTEDWNLG